MKKIFALIFLLSLSPLFGQKHSVADVIVYDWEVVKNAQPDTVFGVSFQKMKLIKLPAELKKFKNLRVLDLSNNKLVSIPNYIGELLFLEDLNLTKNQLEYYPLALCRNNSLRFLRLGRNPFENFPECIESLQNLEYLDMYDTPIATLPESIVRLKKLKEVDLSGIRFSKNFQESWTKKMSHMKMIFDSPCDCFE